MIKSYCYITCLLYTKSKAKLPLQQDHHLLSFRYFNAICQQSHDQYVEPSHHILVYTV